jgi:hypothetical protein
VSTLTSITDALGNAGTGTHTLTLTFSKMIFTTSGTNNGNFGGMAGADAYCTSDANKPTRGTYKAMLVDGTNRVACTSSFCGGSGVSEHVDWVLDPTTLYSRSDGTPIGTTTSAGVFTFPLL